MVFPAAFVLNDPVCATTFPSCVKSNGPLMSYPESGIINTVTKMASEYKIVFPFSFYTFEGSVAADLKFVTVKMRNPKGDTSPASTLPRIHRPG
ncbi:hypothetical protein C8Q78DRAFT_1074351 [Trametes maxima]|nr:hypothetical protein C8Q78DRAFT_1074351 [Trametes maxima]